MISFGNRILTMDIGNKCTLECSACLRQYLKSSKEKIPGEDLTIENFKKMSKYFIGFSFCGQISDPIFNPHLADLLTICKENKKYVSVHTAASHRPKKWWKKTFEANLNAVWYFGIDGLPYESFFYRKHQDGEKLFEMAKLAKKLGIKRVIWQYIIFNYNEDHIEEAKKLAKNENMEFRLSKSSRWGPKNQFKPKNEKNYILKPWETE